MDPWQSPCQAALELYTPYSVPCVTLQMNAMQRKFLPRHFPYFCRRGDAWQGSHEDHGSWVCCTIKIFIWAMINCHSASNIRGQSSDWTWPSLSACFQGIGTGVIGPTADDCMPDCRISPNFIAICSIECDHYLITLEYHHGMSSDVVYLIRYCRPFCIRPI